MNRALLLVGLLGACGGDDGEMVDAPMAPAFEYQSFTARTRSLGIASVQMQLSITDTIGPIACGVAKDHRSALGTSGHQILAAIDDSSFSECPTGTHAIVSNCSTIFGPNAPFIPPSCAYYRRFDAQGQVVGTIAATAGAISVTGTRASCTFTVNLSFAGEAYSDTFTLTNPGTTRLDPWCKQ